MSDNTGYLEEKINRLEMDLDWEKQSREYDKEELSEEINDLLTELKKSKDALADNDLYVEKLEEKLDTCKSFLRCHREESYTLSGTINELCGTASDLYGRLAQAEKQLEDQELLYALLNEYETKVQQLELTLFEYDFNGYRTSAS